MLSGRLTVERPRQEQEREAVGLLQDGDAVGRRGAAVEPERQRRVLPAAARVPRHISHTHQNCHGEIRQDD